MNWNVLRSNVLWLFGLFVLLPWLLGGMLWLLLQIRSVLSWRLTISVISNFFRSLL